MHPLVWLAIILGGALVVKTLSPEVFSGSPGSGGVSPIIGPIGTGLTNDWSDSDLLKLVEFASSLGISDPSIPLRVWANESDNKTIAHNPNGDASGLFQLMPATATGLGYDTNSDPTLANYRALSVSDQLDWAAKYYAPHAGKLNSVARFYVANFLPAELDSADNPDFDLTSGSLSFAYEPNKSFDREGKGFITPSDLVDASQRATGPRTNELISRLSNLVGVS